MKLGVHVLPRFTRDTTDRNRTSPFAFTGNKFEFRMLGSADSIACANIMLNSAVAESLKSYADRLEGAEDFDTAIRELIKKTIKDHKQHHLQRQRLRRRVDQRGHRGERALKLPHDARLHPPSCG